MAHFDFPLEKLKSYRPAEKAPRDFDAFWKRTRTETAATGDAAPHFIQHPDPIFDLVDVYDVTFRGYLGQSVKGWFIEPIPDAAGTPRPCMVSYIGYNGGRGLPVEHLVPAVSGFAHFVMDTRGQGSGGSVGQTPDPVGSGPQQSGFLTKGIESPETYFYRRVFVDAARAVEAAAAHPRVDPRRIALMGGSQGGGIALAAAGLLGNRIKLLMPDVPFLSHFSRATTIVDTMPYAEIGNYLRAHRGATDMVYRTLSYFDTIHFAPKIKARTLMSVALMDAICPPSTIYAVFNRIKAPKDMRIYPFNGHEGGGPFQVAQRMQYARDWL